MAVSVAQNITAVSFSSATSQTANFGACTNPSLLVAIGSMDNVSTTMTVSDSVNGAYAQDGFLNGGNGAAGGGSVGVFSVQNTTTSTKVVTITLGAATDGFLKILELTGVATSSAKDTSATVNVATGLGAAFSLSFTTGTANCAAVMGSTHYSTGAGADTGYTLGMAETAALNAYHISEFDADVGAAGLKTLTLNGYTSTSNHTGVVVAYKADGGVNIVRPNRGYNDRAAMMICASVKDDGKFDSSRSVEYWW